MHRLEIGDREHDHAVFALADDLLDLVEVLDHDLEILAALRVRTGHLDQPHERMVAVPSDVTLSYGSSTILIAPSSFFWNIE